ncbi:MAG: protein-tyrosine-phosphatase [Luteibaculaceae bacterium]
MYTSIKNWFDQNFEEPSAERKAVLAPMIDAVKGKLAQSESVNLNFICTHNSRRSQFGQIWAAVFAHSLALPVKVASGGTEVTACNERTIKALKHIGFAVTQKGVASNPIYRVSYSENGSAENLWSKLYSDSGFSNYIAVLTCSDAEQNCPFIPEAEARISLKYLDPKSADDSPNELKTYLERSAQIASEMWYVLNKVR